MVDRIQKLAQLMYTRRELGEIPYVLLLGSGVSLIPEVRCAFAGTEDWHTFWKKMQNATPKERGARLGDAIAEQNLQSGYFTLAQIITKGYFRLILTLNLDDGIDKTVQCLPSEQTEFLVHKTYNRKWLTKALERDKPRFQIIKLHGDLEIKKLPLTARGEFEMPKDLVRALTRHLDENLIIVGDIQHDRDIQQCVTPTANELWWVNPHRPAPNSFVERIKQKRGAGEIVTGSSAKFNEFFSQLHRAITEAERAERIDYEIISTARPGQPLPEGLIAEGGAANTSAGPAPWEEFFEETSATPSEMPKEQDEWDTSFDDAPKRALADDSAAPVRAGASAPNRAVASLPNRALLALGGLVIIIVIVIVALTQCS